MRVTVDRLDQVSTGRDIRACLARLGTQFTHLEATNHNLHQHVQELWKYGSDMFSQYNRGKEEESRLRSALADALAEAERVRRELAAYQQDSAVAASTISLLRSDCDQLRSSIEAHRQEVERGKDSIQQATSQASALKERLGATSNARNQLATENSVMKKELEDVRSLLGALQGLPTRTRKRKAVM